MFQAQNKETINSTWKVAVSFKIIMTMSVTRPCFTTQHQTCKTKDQEHHHSVQDNGVGTNFGVGVEERAPKGRKRGVGF